MDTFIEMGISPLRLEQLPNIFFADVIVNMEGTGEVEVPSVCKSDFKVYGRDSKGVTRVSKKKYVPFLLSFIPLKHPQKEKIK